MKTALTIAGSDSSGGAGIQADIKTMTANGVFALSAITALTAQNTTGVTGIFETTPEFLAQQLDAVFTDIYPDAIKIGMVSSSALIETIAKKLRQYDAKHIVVDPCVRCFMGGAFCLEEADAKSPVAHRNDPIGGGTGNPVLGRMRDHRPFFVAQCSTNSPRRANMWSMGPEPLPRSSMADRQPEIYALARSTAASRG